MTQKFLIKMQILPTKNPNFEKPSRNLSNRTKVKILKKKFFLISLKKIWFRVCSVTAEMFEHRNSGENRRKKKARLKSFVKLYPGVPFQDNSQMKSLLELLYTKTLYIFK